MDHILPLKSRDWVSIDLMGLESSNRVSNKGNTQRGSVGNLVNLFRKFPLCIKFWMNSFHVLGNTPVRTVIPCT